MTDKSRVEFEVWADSQGWRVQRNDHGGYDDMYLTDVWEGWQASRAALPVDAILDAIDALAESAANDQRLKPKRADYQRKRIAELQTILPSYKEST